MTLVPALVDPRAVLLQGDCVHLGSLLAPGTVDAIVTDPPAGINFMGRSWDGDKGGVSRFPRGFGPWLAGFIDGEGNFDIHRQRRDSGDYYYCRFELTLRADDGGVLNLLRQYLGGKIYYGDPSPNASEGSNPRARWELVSREECLTLVELLDANPLQTKKARDFAIWREALAVSSAHAGTSVPHLMAPFWEQLRGTRPYAGKVTDPTEFRQMRHEHAWIAWLTERMRVALTLLKPGGHALVWAIPRTSHWTATALEEAGFEIRDIVMHLFGTGFPKSLDVSKAIDAARTGTNQKQQPRNRPDAVALPDGTDTSGRTTLNRYAGARVRSSAATDEAMQWEGWGTALKPAAEHWILARKPLDGTVAANVLTHGTGGLNIDACRIGTEDTWAPSTRGPSESIGTFQTKTRTTEQHEAGRWPAHVTLDEEAAAMLDEQSGTLKSGNINPDAPRRTAGGNGVTMGRMTGVQGHSYGDSGGASRFFYVAKAPRSEKDAGLEHLPVRSGGEATDREEGSAGLSNPRAGAGRTGGARNFHPTVKSIALMRWLCRLITPPGGTVLDMFTGSGTTAIAALQEGFNFIGTELDRDDDGKPLGYMEIAAGRIRHALTAPAGASEDS